MPATMSRSTPPARTTADPLRFRGSEISLAPPSTLLCFNNEDLSNMPPPSSLPDPAVFASHIARNGLEALMGRRPVHHLRSWFTPSLYHAFSRRASMMSKTQYPHQKMEQFRIMRVRCMNPQPHVAEAAVLIQAGEKIHAVAVRLEVRRGKWHVAAFESA